jgi:hypothetical protein
MFVQYAKKFFVELEDLGNLEVIIFIPFLRVD